MAMSVTKGEGLTVITVKADPKSNCPLVCQLLGSLCYSPVCSVSHRLRTLLGGAQLVLATLQIMLGLFTISLGAVAVGNSFLWNYMQSTGVPFWLGGTFIAIGVLGIFAEKFPSSFLVFLNAFASLACSALTVAAIVLYSMNLAQGEGLIWLCQWSSGDRGFNYWTTVSPEVQRMKEREWERELELCKKEKYILMMMLRGITILLIVLSVVLLCVAISTSVLTIKALCKNCREGKENCELREPLLENVSNNLDA